MREKIVIIGSGWAGSTLAHSLDDKKYQVTVISPEPTVAYTPLLASAACGLFAFSLAEEPIRRKSKAIRYLKAQVDDIDFERRKCICKPSFDDMAEQTFEESYDKVVIAPGCTVQTFGTPGVMENAFFVKNVRDAKALRQRLEDILEMASLPTMSEEQQRDLLHIIVVGGGPTGVELAAEMFDLIHHDLSVLYPDLKDKISISLHDVADQILTAFDKGLSEYAISSFKGRGVEPKTGSHITKVEPGVMHTKEDGEIKFGMLVWATGNKEVPLVDKLDVAKSKPPRILTNHRLQVLKEDRSVIDGVYAIGDAADIEGGELPTTAEVASQKGEYLSKTFNNDNTKPGDFVYRQQATIAYIGQQDGVISGQQDWSGASAWLAWRTKNLSWARSWRNKVLIVVSWALNRVYGKEVAPK